MACSSHNNYLKMCSLDFIEFNIQWLALVTIIILKCVQTLLNLIFNGLL